MIHYIVINMLWYENVAIDTSYIMCFDDSAQGITQYPSMW